MLIYAELTAIISLGITLLVQKIYVCHAVISGIFVDTTKETGTNYVTLQ